MPIIGDYRSSTKMYAEIFVFVLSFYAVSGQGTVDLQRESNSSTVCIWKLTTFTCETTVTQILQWEDGDGNTVRFTSGGNDPGDNMTVGSVLYTLTGDMSSVLTSTATVNSSTDGVLLICTNDGPVRSVQSDVAGRPSAPRNFEIGTGEPGISSRLSWEAPNDSPNCCERYIRKIVSDTGEVEEEVLPLTTTATNVFLNSSGTVTVFCQDAAGRNGTSTNSIPLPTGPRVILDTSDVKCCGPSSVTAFLVDNFFGSAVCMADVVSCKYGNRMVMAEQVDGNCTYRCNMSEPIKSTITVLATYMGGSLTLRNSTDICVQSGPCGPDIGFIIVIAVACVLGALLFVVLIYAIIITIKYCYDPQGSGNTPKSDHISMGEKNF